jgi:acyl carrier protein
VPKKFKKKPVTRETHLQKELGLDSIGLLSMVFRFEEIFKVDIGALNLQINVAQLRTVNDVITLSRDILKQAGALSDA